MQPAGGLHLPFALLPSIALLCLLPHPLPIALVRLGPQGPRPSPDKFKMGEYQDLLTQSLLATNHVHHCAIINLKNVSVVTASKGFKLEPVETQAFVNAFKQPGNIREGGFSFKNVNYLCVRADMNSVYGKYNKEGLLLVKTESYIICATYTEGMYPSVCVEAVEKLGEYFKTKGK